MTQGMLLLHIGALLQEIKVEEMNDKQLAMLADVLNECVDQCADEMRKREM